jgi:hypothetical protein
VTVQQITPSDGSQGVTIAWDLGTVFLQAGTVLDVPPGGALEATIGLANLSPLTGAEQADLAQGGGGAVSN